MLELRSANLRGLIETIEKCGMQSHAAIAAVGETDWFVLCERNPAVSVLEHSSVVPTPLSCSFSSVRRAACFSVKRGGFLTVYLQEETKTELSSERSELYFCLVIFSTGLFQMCARLDFNPVSTILKPMLV